MDIAIERMRPRTVVFHVLNGKGELPRGTLAIDLVESRAHVRWVAVDTPGVTWVRPTGSAAGGFTSTIGLRVGARLAKCPGFRVRVDYSGSPPVVRGIRSIGAVRAAVGPASADESPATRIARRAARMESIPDPRIRKYYSWFTLLEERSDEEVLAAKRPRAATKGGGTFDVAAAISGLREDLQSILQTRMAGARRGDDALVATPEFTSDVATNVLRLLGPVFASGVAASQELAGGKKKPGDFAGEITAAFLAFCQGDLRVEDGISDLNAEPDSAMVFLFAEYALTLLQVVDRFGAPDGESLDDPAAQTIVRGLFSDPEIVSFWKRVAASFVLGQRAYLRAYAPRRLTGPARFEDYARTNYDPAARLDAGELEGLRAPYDSLAFDPKVAPLSDPCVRNLLWRHALNACEAFPGIFEEERADAVGPLALPSDAASATVDLRARRGASPSIRRQVRHEVASLAALRAAVGSGRPLRELGIDEARRRHLATMLAAWASARGTALDAAALGIGEASTIDTIALRLGDLLAGDTEFRERTR